MIRVTSDPASGEEYGSLAETAYVMLRQRIESGDLGPGTVLKESEMAALLNMGRTPVREGLQRLRSEGLLVHVKQGYVVLELTPRDILNVFQVRGMLEAGAARQAARAKTRVDLARLLDALDQEKAAVERGDALHAARMAESFFQILVGASRNRFLEGNLQSVRLLTIPYFKHIVLEEGMAARCYDEHVRIFKAIESGDPEESEVASRDHFRNIMWTVLKRVEEASPETADLSIVWPPNQDPPRLNPS
jgi:DNA-binding GntR family transcriptional regulator